VRATYAFTRDLTLQAYMQPFVAVGDYSRVRKLALPHSYEFTPVTLDYNPDFNSKSLQSNVVLRWEYVKGSTVYAVWNRTQSDSSRPGVFRPFRDLGSALGAGEADNVFIVKRGKIYTPPIASGALAGVTRGVVFELAAEAGIEISEPDMTRYDLFTADECFLTGTAAELIPVVTLDRRDIGDGKPGPITKRLMTRFHELTQSSGTVID